MALSALTVAGAVGLITTDAHHRGTSLAAQQTRPGQHSGGSHVVSSPGATLRDGHTSVLTGRMYVESDHGTSALPAHSGTGKRIVFDMTRQRVWLVDADNHVQRTYLVSGSKFHNLAAGTYHVYSKSLNATAYDSAETMRYMVRFASGRTAPIGFHSVPAYPDGRLVEQRSGLGHPASDGCVRQWLPDAHALWRFAPLGTTVVVLA